MQITFKITLIICGLSHPDAAKYLGVSIASIKAWSRGRGTPPVRVWDKLAELVFNILNIAELCLPALADVGATTGMLQMLEYVKHNSRASILPTDRAMQIAGTLAVLIAIDAKNNNDRNTKC